MKIPYGESNFKTVLTGGYVYVDKTAYIHKLEEAGKYLFLLRPRRFGQKPVRFHAGALLRCAAQGRV